MNADGQSVCLCMIVKNEAPVIRRCLDSLRGFVDAWVIVDTGSTDGTQDVVREHLRDLPGELFERPWVDFARNRSESLALARGRADYVFVIDADEVLAFDAGFVLPRLEHDAYQFAIESGGISYFKTQLVRDALDWSFRGVVHEYIYSERARTEAVLPGVRTLRFPDGARARDPRTYRRDALLLEQALIEEPDNARYVFYLAQSYRDAGEPELALRHYRRRAALGGWPEEVWYSLYQVAEIQARRGDPWPEVQQAYLTAFQAKPDRAGPLYRIGVHYQQAREFHLAHLFFRQAVEIPYPAHDRLFIDKPIYDVLLPLEYAVASYYVGDDAAAIETCTRLLNGVELPPELQAQVADNRRFSLDRLFPRRADAPARDERVVVLSAFRDPGPGLDDCVESLLEQAHADFVALFLDDGSRDAHADRLPDDPRFRCLRTDTPRGLAARALEALRQTVRPGDLVLPLDAFDWLADAEALGSLARFFAERDCLAAYGQHRHRSGHLGAAVPLARASDYERLRVAPPNVVPVAFRASVLQDASPEVLDAWLRPGGAWCDGEWAAALGLAALETAGWGACHFNERALVVLDDGAHPVRGRAPVPLPALETAAR